jgi:hypothetical protein
VFPDRLDEFFAMRLVVAKVVIDNYQVEILERFMCDKLSRGILTVKARLTPEGRLERLPPVSHEPCQQRK